ncbi:MAG: GNAT family N-acetyltransferase [Bacteroidota bacterium]|nr:GNAT family N-acetyltransferase [Bacteroidota bacterium]
MEQIPPQPSRESIEAELTADRFLRYTNKGNNQVFLVNAHDSPRIMDEIGRLRELAFRTAGGGTGKALDIDDYDIAEIPYQQLVVWDPEEGEMVAGYRLINCSNILDHPQGEHLLATSHLFHFSDEFKRDFLPYTIELGRSFVQPKYQKGVASRKGIFALDNLWDGLGALIKLNPRIRYLFGKVTMYPQFDREARNLILAFMQHYFPDNGNLVYPIQPLVTEDELEPFMEPWKGLQYKEGYLLLNQKVRQRNENIPPLINSYMNLSSTMRTFGTALNDEFGEVEETGILVTINDIHQTKKDRYLGTYERDSVFGRPPTK